jgi:hypothetical protein
MPMFKCDIWIKGRMTRPSYNGYVKVYCSENKTAKLKMAIARKLINTSFPDGIRLDEIKIMEIQEI